MITIGVLRRMQVPLSILSGNGSVNEALGAESGSTQSLELSMNYLIRNPGAVPRL